MAINYLDFDLSIEPIDPVAGRYRARVLTSPVGEASTEFVLPFSSLEVENYILKMGRPRQGVRGLNSSEGRAAQEFGRKLYDAIFQGEVRDCLRSSLNAVSQQTDQGLRLRLRLSDAPALAELPWEYLYDTSLRRFFAHSAATPIVRYLDLPERIQPLAVQPPLKILVMIASTRDYGKLDVEAEWRKVQEALGDLVQRRLVTLTRLEKATLTALQRQLRREQYHIFHFIGHGGFDQQTQEGVLLLEDENGLTRLVAGSYIGALLHDHRSLRLAILNACEGARTAQSDPFAGVAQTLVQQGIPAVIAMQFEITDKAAIIFAHEFYSALADRYPVDAALAEARKAIFAEGNDVEWGTPVLYLRAQDGAIFNLAEAHEARPLPKVEPATIKPTPHESIYQGRSYLVEAIIILLVLTGIWLGANLPVFQQPGASTLTPTVVVTSPTLSEPVTNTTKTIAGITFIYVPAGQFMMGSDIGDDNEKPAQQLYLSNFWIMKTEVTNAQYRAFVDVDGYTQKEFWTLDGWKWRTDNKIIKPNCWNDKQYNRPDYPLVCISWYEATAYTRWLSKKTGLKISLPTEAQWEKAARGHDGRTYPWGNNVPTDQLLNYNGKIGHTSRVGNYPDGKSIYGALDMAGNVWEWTNSLYIEYPYKDNDGREDPNVNGKRVMRGGSWYEYQRDVRASSRFPNEPKAQDPNFGFRCVISNF